MPFKSKAQQRWMFAAEKRGEVPPGTAKKWAKHTPNIKDLPEKKEPPGGSDQSMRICPHCGTRLTKYSYGRGKKYTRSPDYKEETCVGCYACDNNQCPYLNKKDKVGIKYAVPIHSVSEDVEVVLNGKKYLFEAGDEIIIV